MSDRTIAALAPTPQRLGFLPVVQYLVPPPATTSRYVQTVAVTTFYNQGCNAGQAVLPGTDSVIVLNFGQPWYDGVNYGTFLVASGNPFVSIAQIAAGVQGFLDGFYQCARTLPYPTVKVAIGINNCGSNGPCLPGGGNVSNAHGQAWGQMINGLQSYVVSHSYDSQEKIAGAMDAEAAYNYPADTRSWLDGYKTVTSNKFYNFGSCDNCGSCEVGCPPNMPNGWTYEDVWYISWGALPAYPLPEIYATNGLNAKQWYVIDLYSIANHGNAMNFQGAFTQWQACQDPAHGPCPGADNSPSQGWTWLFSVLNADSRTRQELYWSTDITYQTQ